jgi:hypothetical protein
VPLRPQRDLQTVHPDPLAIAPVIDGPMKSPRLPIELIKAIPEAAENPDRNLLGIEKNGPKKL